VNLQKVKYIKKGDDRKNEGDEGEKKKSD